jgi:hypothetical protein
MWEEAVVYRYKTLSQNLPGGAEENHEKLRITGFQAEI